LKPLKAISDIVYTELTDEQWKEIKKILPHKSRKGRPRADDRRTLNAILFIIRGHIPWNFLPKEFGDDSTANRRLREWEKEGIWVQIAEKLAEMDGTAIPMKINDKGYGPMASSGERR
jgi:transposase